jgi:hypothetical protein
MSELGGGLFGIYGSSLPCPEKPTSRDAVTKSVWCQHQTLTRLLLEPNLSDLFAKMFHPYLSAIVSVLQLPRARALLGSLREAQISPTLLTTCAPESALRSRQIRAPADDIAFAADGSHDDFFPNATSPETLSALTRTNS